MDIDRRRVLGLSGALAAALLAGCTGGDSTLNSGGNEPPTGDDRGSTPTETPSPPVDETALEELVRGNADFAFDLHRRLVAEAGGNVFASPHSVSVALAMTYAGARGDTREQMREALGFELDEEALHAAFASLNDRVDGNDNDGDSSTETPDEPTETSGGDGGETDGDDAVPFRLSLANAVWGQEEYPWLNDYLDVLEAHYGAGLREVDYRQDAEGAREEINEWVAGETEDRIDELLPEGSLNYLTRLVLTNAVYFKANWEEPFPDGNTRSREFTALDGSTADVPTMSDSRSFRYAEVDGAQAVELPYAGGEASMLVLLPPTGDFEAFEERVDAALLAAVTDALSPRDGEVALPRFEFESSLRLKPALRALGMEDAFEEGAADFSGMADLEAAEENLLVDDVYHDAFVAVDEDGTEAAAATGVVVRAESAPANPFEFVADRPFLFAIRHVETGALLFVGRVVDHEAME